MFTNKKNAFTLIELLIVVAIIAILAAIAIPNFLAAQVRSKVARVRGELRTVTTGLEAYNVDENMYPKTAPSTLGTACGVPVALTTPVAYLTGVKSLIDPFLQPGRTMAETGGSAIAEKTWYTYHRLRPDDIGLYAAMGTTPGYMSARDAYGDWRLLSVGPDGIYLNMTPYITGHGWRHTIEYDPTNGVNSLGNIYRSQKHGEPFEWRGDPQYFTEPGL